MTERCLENLTQRALWRRVVAAACAFFFLFAALAHSIEHAAAAPVTITWQAAEAASDGPGDDGAAGLIAEPCHGCLGVMMPLPAAQALLRTGCLAAFEVPSARVRPHVLASIAPPPRPVN